VFTTSGILFAVSSAVGGNSLNAMLALGFASYLSLYPALLFVPLALLCYDQRAQKAAQAPNTALFILQHGAILSGSIAGLLGLSVLITGNFWEFMSATYGFHLLVPDLTPNVGLWWYFFIEMFDSFREFFLGVFWLHLASYVGGFTARLRRQPLFIITSLLGVFAVFKPYPSISDASLFFALLPLYRHLFPCEYLSIMLDFHPGPTNSQTSDAVHFLCHFGSSILESAWPRLLPPLDLRGIRQCQLFLRHYPCVESRALHSLG
jgi:phosphatidylinositol glycan class U